MVLGVNSLFGTSGINSKEIRAATVIVANDGTGDTDSIIEALDLLPPNGGSIYLKEGTYTVNTTINVTKPNTMIYGSGLSSIITSGINAHIFRVSGTNCTLSDFTIYGSGAGNASQNGLAFSVATSSKVSRLYITNCGGRAIFMSACQNVIISQCEIYANNRWTIVLAGQDASADWTTGPCLNNIIIGNIIRNNAYQGIYLSGSAGNHCDYNMIIGNRLLNNVTAEIEIANVNCNKTLIDGNMIVTTAAATIIDGGTATLLGTNQT